MTNLWCLGLMLVSLVLYIVACIALDKELRGRGISSSMTKYGIGPDVLFLYAKERKKAGIPLGFAFYVASSTLLIAVTSIICFFVI
jgi:hypothetical protein